MENIFKGCMPALMTPCNEDLSPNFDLLVKKAEELIKYGMSAVVYCGSMGDWPLLTDEERKEGVSRLVKACLLYTSPSPRDRTRSRMPSSA